MKFAVVRVGSSQYLVKEKETLTVDRQLGEMGQSLELETLAVGDDKDITLGKPSITPAVKATVTHQVRGPKVHVMKYKRKVRYRRNVGHRQDTTTLTIDTI